MSWHFTKPLMTQLLETFDHARSIQATTSARDGRSGSRPPVIKSVSTRSRTKASQDRRKCAFSGLIQATSAGWQTDVQLGGTLTKITLIEAA